jgi:hypothetical protein
MHRDRETSCRKEVHREAQRRGTRATQRLDGERAATDASETTPLVHRMRAEAVTANAMLLTLLIAKDDVEELEIAA